MDYRKCVLCLLILWIVLQMKQCQAQDISVMGEWFRLIDASDLQGGAGTDLNSVCTSDPDIVLINITHPGYWWMDDWYWRVDIRMENINWDNRMRLQVRRTSDGISLGGSITGGTTWRRIRNVDREFFSGVRHHVIVGVQYRVRNISIQIPPDTYTAEVVYTVVEM